jgi:capsular polysaccharide transport system permease protein
MTTKLTAKRFRIRRPDPVQPLPSRAAEKPAPKDGMLFEQPEDGFGDMTFVTPRPQDQGTTRDIGPTDLEAIRREGLTGRQLRLARRLAQKHEMPATSDFDAVRLLRQAGIDPFQRTNLIELVGGTETEAGGDGGGLPPAPGSRALVPEGDGVKLPQTIKPVQVPSTEVRAETNHAAEIMRIQRDLARRRRRRAALLSLRLMFFIGLPTLLTGFYFFFVATPMYATKTEFVIQQSGDSMGAGRAGGLGGLLTGTGFATSQDSITVQGYLQSRDAMLRLDADHGFRAHFESDQIDPIQRLAPDASFESAYKAYTRHIHISYDPSEGIIKMEVVAANPEKSAEFARALVGYAEEQVKGARETYENTERDMLAAQQKVVDLQERYKVLSSEVEVSLITTQIGNLDTQLTADRLSLQQMESNANPNKARMEPLKRRIATLESEIANLRAKLTEAGDGQQSLAVVQGELMVAQSDVETRRLLLAQALQAMEAARIEVNRQVRYLSLSVSPIPPDEPTYPRAFEYTMVALFIFAGIYLMISMTVAILREQVSA